MTAHVWRTLPTVFTLLTSADVLAGTIAESDFAADLAQAIRGTAPLEYAGTRRFFDSSLVTGLGNGPSRCFAPHLVSPLRSVNLPGVSGFARSE